jgi:hypothetical protein
MEKEKNEKIDFGELVTSVDMCWDEFKVNPWNVDYPIAEFIHKMRYETYQKIVPDITISEYCIIDGLVALIKFKGDTVYFDSLYSEPFKKSVRNFIKYMCYISNVMQKNIKVSLAYVEETYNRYKKLFFTDKHQTFVIEEFLKDMHYLYK